MAWGAVTMLRSIEGVLCIPHVVHVSGACQFFRQHYLAHVPFTGTIKHTQLAAIEHNRVVVARYRTRANAPAAYKDSYEEYLESSQNEIETLKD
jgi:ribonuclease P/MRP protein subunit POP5